MTHRSVVASHGQVAVVVENTPPIDDAFAAGVRDAAIASFWETISAAFPDVDSGDLPPGEDARFFDAAERALRAWLDANRTATEQVVVEVPRGAIVSVEGHRAALDLDEGVFAVSLDGEPRRFVDKDGDTWEETSAGSDEVRVVILRGRPSSSAGVWTLSQAEARYGPLAEVTQ